MQLLLDKTPEAIKNISLNDLQGRVIACDASIVLLLLNQIFIAYRPFINF
jgi:hypothetical protein